MSFFTSALVGRPFEYSYDFEGATNLAESGAILPLPQGIYAFVADVGLFSVLQGIQSYLKEMYLPYYCSCEVEWDDDAFVAWFAYIHASGDVLDILAREVTCVNRTASDVQVKK